MRRHHRCLPFPVAPPSHEHLRWRPGRPVDVTATLASLRRGAGDPALRRLPDGTHWRATRTPDGETGLNYLCPGFKAFFHHVDVPMRFMAERLRAGEAPADIVQFYAAEDARRGRNEPCTCGSGRKWKHCHGA